jgi:hypothetical protein
MNPSASVRDLAQIAAIAEFSVFVFCLRVRSTTPGLDAQEYLFMPAGKWI